MRLFYLFICFFLLALIIAYQPGILPDDAQLMRALWRIRSV